MPVFKYVGMIGAKKTEGEIESQNEESARQLLSGRNIKIQSLSKKAQDIKVNIPGMGNVTTRDMVIFTRQFSTMLNAGIPLVECLNILSQQVENPKLRTIISTVKVDVESGKPLNDSLRKHPKVFNALYSSLVEAGEAGGLLTNVLDRLSVYMEKADALRGKVKSAMAYPTAVFFIAIIIVGGLLTFVIPQFKTMFEDMGQKLPALTAGLIATSDYVKGHILIIIGIMVAIGVVFTIWKKTPAGAKILDGVAIKAPIFGNIVRKSAVARFTRTLGTLISSGVDILQAMEITARTSGNLVIEEAILRSRQSIAGGSEISKPLAETGVFPPMVVHMISAGEKSGALEEMLSKIADFYEVEVDNAVEGLTSMLEPLVMVFIGGLLGVIVIAMFLPILTMSTGA